MLKYQLFNFTYSLMTGMWWPIFKPKLILLHWLCLVSRWKYLKSSEMSKCSIRKQWIEKKVSVISRRPTRTNKLKAESWKQEKLEAESWKQEKLEAESSKLKGKKLNNLTADFRGRTRTIKLKGEKLATDTRSRTQTDELWASIALTFLLWALSLQLWAYLSLWGLCER